MYCVSTEWDRRTKDSSGSYNVNQKPAYRDHLSICSKHKVHSSACRECMTTLLTELAVKALCDKVDVLRKTRGVNPGGDRGRVSENTIAYLGRKCVGK